MGEEWLDSGYVFTTMKGTPLHPDNLNRTLNRVCERARLRRIRVHDLRHTFANLMMSNLVPVEVVSKLLGHSLPSTTQNIYRHVSQEEQTQHMVNLSDLLKPTVRILH